MEVRQRLCSVDARLVCKAVHLSWAEEHNTQVEAVGAPASQKHIMYEVSNVLASEFQTL